MAGVGNTQIINGKPYTMYSPQWYAAWEGMSASNPQAAKDAGMYNENAPGVAAAAGRAAGEKAGASITTLREQVPDLFGAGSSSSSSGSTAGSSTTVPRAQLLGGSTGPIAPAPPAPSGLPAGYSPSAGVGGPVQLKPTDTSAADAARFGRAKDTVGQTTRASLTGLRSALASRGQLGGAGESHGTSAIFTKGMGDLNEVTRDNAIEGSKRDADRAALEFTGGITQRGQDMSAAQAAEGLAARLREVSYQGEITQRGQDMSAMRDAQTFEAEEKRSQQMILDRILNALTPLY